MDKKNYDSDFCGSLPLHNTNLIQPYGYLVVLDAQSLNVVQVSENIEDLLAAKPADVVNKPWSAFVAAGEADLIKAKFDTGITDKIPLSFTVTTNGSNVNLLGLVHAKSGYLIVELERVAPDSARYFTEVFQEVKYAMAAIEIADSVEAVCHTAIHELKKLSGFDGVMMYRFDSDWNGTVIAEEKEPGLENYLGHTFPASDVPKQARQLYLKNPYRLIPNREYTPVRLYPVINPVSNSFVDLTDCNLRSVAGVHLEYMKNMNVMASMSIRVIKDGQLWGLISCHNITAKYLSYELCSVFELLSNVISYKISSIYNKADFDFAARLQEQRAELVEQVYTNNDLAKGLLQSNGTNILEMFNATGAVVIEDGRFESAGEIPSQDDLENLVFWLQGKDITKTYANNNLAGAYDDAAEYSDIASGVLVIPVDKDKGNYILCFRPEVVRTINWGGNPNEAINFEKDGKTYHPRNSFKLWQQTVRQTSLPWDQHELTAAEMFRSFAFEFKTKQIFS